jgi:Zn ribbon nucleic-acid-binding protein
MSCPTCRETDAARLRIKHSLGAGDQICECPACGALFSVQERKIRPISKEEADRLIPPPPACPKCRSTDVLLEATALIEIFLLSCRDCGFQEAADEYQRSRWGY